MSKGSDTGHDQFYFSLQDSAHLVLYHAYLHFFIFGSIPNERKYFIFIMDKDMNILCMQARELYWKLLGK